MRSLRASQAAVVDQEMAGIDVITGGEMHRRTHNRHSPPNAMLNHFWQKIPSFAGATRAKQITPHDPNVFHPAAICRGPVPEALDLGLVEEFTTVSAYARKPVKITMTGPHLLAAVAYDEYYNDLPRMMLDFGKLLRWNFTKLVDAGCRHLQIDEPYFTVADDREVAAAVEAINLALEDVPDHVHVMLHYCQGNYAVGPDYDGQIGHRYFDVGRYKADLVCRIECDGYMIEHDMAHHYEKRPGRQAARRRRGRCPVPQCRDRRAGRRAHPAPSLAGAGTDDHHQLVRPQPSAAPHRPRQAEGDDRGQGDPERQGLLARHG